MTKILKKVAALVSILAIGLGMSATSALAWNWSSSDDITVNNDKIAEVENFVTVEAYTGLNTADGGSGGDGGDGGVGGKINKRNDNNDGGNGGAGGAGGRVSTGDASARGKVVNIINSDTTIISCDCEDTGDITVNNRDRARVGNLLGVTADTGINDASGGEGGEGGEGGVGGKVNINNDNNDGGNGDDGGDGGSVRTGNARASGKVFNKVNTIITRIR